MLRLHRIQPATPLLHRIQSIMPHLHLIMLRLRRIQPATPHLHPVIPHLHRIQANMPLRHSAHHQPCQQFSPPHLHPLIRILHPSRPPIVLPRHSLDRPTRLDCLVRSTSLKTGGAQCRCTETPCLSSSPCRQASTPATTHRRCTLDVLPTNLSFQRARSELELPPAPPPRRNTLR